ncbi:sugar transferase [Microbacterium sp. 3J1]|uniref:sugar transferase n=1 Tax=Microbacterium sp. 3J1 TaxID=861269 RepID=UPI000A3E4123|nr:sugar transferase [Microbacterium sp. 3J1]
MTSAGSRPYDLLKRLLDAAGAAVALVALSPVILVTALFVAVNLGRPVIFSQPRPGRGGRVFTLYKFRSMRGVDAARGHITDEQRLTRFGRLLRASSLDELPSLWNVFRGDMSFVGPRPLLVEYLERYTPEQARRHDVRPGITGLAQVSGRNAVAWDDRFRLDVHYVDRRSLALDAKVLVATVRSVIRREGISAEGHATMRKFGEVDA